MNAYSESNSSGGISGRKNNGGVFLENAYSIGTSLKDESSYAHHSDRSNGHSVMDRYIHYLLEYMGELDATPSEEGSINSINSSISSRNSSSNSSKWFNMDEISLKEALVDSMYYTTTTSSSNIRNIRQKKLMADVGCSNLGCDVNMGDVPMSDFIITKQNYEKRQKLVVDKVEFWG